MLKVKLTKKVVEKARPKEKRYVIWDSGVPGFGCRIYPSGRKKYIVVYDNHSGQRRRPVLGFAGVITTEAARDKARKWLVAVSEGDDPYEEVVKGRGVPTMRNFAKRYLKEHAEVKKKPSSVVVDKSNLRNHIIPALGHKRIDQISRADIQRLHYEMANVPGAANHVIGLLSKIFNLAEKWGVLPGHSNPCRHIDKYPDRKYERYLTAEEFGRLADVLAEAEKDGSIAIGAIRVVRLLILTGCRLGEILTLKWEYIDIGAKRACLPESKTGQKIVYLAQPAIDVLATISRVDGNPYVVVGRFNKGGITRIGHQWIEIRKRANLDGVRLHDLRHSFASVGAGMGESLPIIGRLLGHTQAQTTARYMHLAAQPVIEAGERIVGQIQRAMEHR